MIIDIELKDRDHIKELSHKIHNRLENIAFTIIQRIPKKYIPCWLMEWLSRYLDKRINELKQQSIKMTWKNMYLQKAVDDMRKSK